jgi:hypothetical protein
LVRSVFGVTWARHLARVATRALLHDAHWIFLVPLGKASPASAASRCISPTSARFIAKIRKPVGSCEFARAIDAVRVPGGSQETDFTWSDCPPIRVLVEPRYERVFAVDIAADVNPVAYCAEGRRLRGPRCRNVIGLALNHERLRQVFAIKSMVRALETQNHSTNGWER